MDPSTPNRRRPGMSLNLASATSSSSSSPSVVAVAVANGFVAVDRNALCAAAGKSGKFNPFELTFAAFNAAIDQGVSREDAPFVTQRLLQGFSYDPLESLLIVDTNPPQGNSRPAPAAIASGRRYAQDIVCAVAVPSPSSDLPAIKVDLAEPECTCCQCSGCPDAACSSSTVVHHQPEPASPASTIVSSSSSLLAVPSSSLSTSSNSRTPARRRSIGSGRYIVAGKSSLSVRRRSSTSSAKKAAQNTAAWAASTLALNFYSMMKSAPLRRLARRSSKPLASSSFLMVPSSMRIAVA